MLTNNILTIVEEQLRIFYKNIDYSERLASKLDLLSRQKIEVESDLKNSNFSLEDKTQSIQYDLLYSKGSIKTSPQERLLEEAFKNLETQLNKINYQIIETKILLRNIETDINDMNLIIESLDDDSKKFIKLRYKNKYAFSNIGYSLNMSETSIRRLRIEVLANISQYVDVSLLQN
jgi:hypothetical protein